MDDTDIDFIRHCLRFEIYKGIVFEDFQKWKEFLLEIEDPSMIAMFAIYALKGRWPEAEPYIVKDPKAAHEYATHILKDRWPEAEPYIVHHPSIASQYARDVIKGRWPEAEESIKEFQVTWKRYKYLLKAFGQDIDVWQVDDWD